MGRLGKSEQGDYNVQYTKLKEDITGLSGESAVQVMPGFEGYVSFSCRQCGHLQIFQGAELEMILGKSLKLAFRSNKKDNQPDAVQATSFSDTHMDNSIKNNIPLTSQTSYKPFQESLDGSSIGIPVLHNPGLERATLSSDESNSPTHFNQFKRLVEKPSLMKRIGKGFAFSVSDEEYPLVSEGSSSIPGSQSNISLLQEYRSNAEATTLRLGEASSDLNQITKWRGNQEGGKSSQYNSSMTSGEEIELKPIQVNNAASEFHRKEASLRMAPWYQEGIPREIALEILSQEPIGSFMVRKSTTKLGCFALSVRVPRSFQPKGIAHYLILRTNKGFRIKGFTKDFSSLASLIAHHSVMPELLPCPLSLSRYHPVCVISDCRKDFADIHPEPID